MKRCSNRGLPVSSITSTMTEIKNIIHRCRCRGKYHHFCFDHKGHAFLPDHTKKELKAEEVARALCGVDNDRCTCLQLFRAWQSTDILMQYPNDYVMQKLKQMRSHKHERRCARLADYFARALKSCNKEVLLCNLFMTHIRSSGALDEVEAMTIVPTISIYVTEASSAACLVPTLIGHSKSHAKTRIVIRLAHNWHNTILKRQHLIPKTHLAVGVDESIPMKKYVSAYKFKVILDKIVVDYKCLEFTVDEWQRAAVKA